MFENSTNDGESPRPYQSSIQVVALDESSSLLQHRHTTTQELYSHSHPLIDPLNDSTDETPPSLSRHVSDHWDNYVTIVERRPLLTKSLTATIILGGADLFAQALEHARGISDRSRGVDWPRAARFAAFGLFGAPWSHYYFYWLDHWLPPSKKPCSWTTLIKVFIDQFIQAPLLLAFMICALSIMKGEGFQGMKQDMTDTFVGALLANCTYYLKYLLLFRSLVLFPKFSRATFWLQGSCGYRRP